MVGMPKKAKDETLPDSVREALEFPLVEALLGRRARRFSMGASIPDGPLAFTSQEEPLPLDETERMMVLSAAGGTTGWHFMIMRHPGYAPHLSNYSAAAGGRTFPSAAGIHTSELFFTDDTGTYFFPTRDAHPRHPSIAQEGFRWEDFLADQKQRIRKIQDNRLIVPTKEPHMEGHNFWCANRPGSLLVIPVADLAQHLIGLLCFLLQNRFVIFDDIHKSPIPGIEKFHGLADTAHPYPLSYVEQYALTEATAELATSCYAGALMLQAMGLGGWMYDGIDRHAIFGATGTPEAPGMGFRYDTDDRWSIPNPTGLPGVFEAYCPPHYPDMRRAVDAYARRKFGPGGPFHPDTPGPWKESSRIRSSAQVHSEEFRECVALQAQAIFDRFGKFPGTVPSVFALTYLQAHHLDLAFYEHYFGRGAYLRTHAAHLSRWHGKTAAQRKKVA